MGSSLVLGNYFSNYYFLLAKNKKQTLKTVKAVVLTLHCWSQLLNLGLHMCHICIFCLCPSPLELETSVPKDVPLNQLQQSNQRTTSTLVPPSRIKEELEEMCISQEQQQLKQQRQTDATDPTPACEERIHHDQLQGLELDPTVNEDPQPDASNNSLLSRSDGERSVVLTPNHGHQLLPNSPVAESQDRSETPGRHIDTLIRDENTTSATVNEPTPNKKCKYKSQTSITGAKLTSNERRNDKNPTSEGN